MVHLLDSSTCINLQGNASAAAAAESLVADEASEAAKAAAKKAKKQKAKTRRQQARSEATSTSPPAASEPSASKPSALGTSAAGSLQAQQNVEPTAAQHHSSPSSSIGHIVPPDQDAVGVQTQLQHMTVHDSVMHTLPVNVALDEQESTSAAAAAAAAAAGGAPAGNAAAVGASQGDVASFLDQLFCCPITKVPLCPYFYPTPAWPAGAGGWGGGRSPGRCGRGNPA